MILFLDFDGVLHPDAVYLRDGKPVLCAEGELFMWAPILEDALRPYPAVQIVLSTSWVRVLKNFSRTRSYLPAELRKRVVGATWHSAMGRHHEASHRIDANWFVEMTRYAQIARYVERAGQRAARWIAIDDDGVGWSPDCSDRLIRTSGNSGLSCERVQAQLARALGTES